MMNRFKRLNPHFKRIALPHPCCRGMNKGIIYYQFLIDDNHTTNRKHGQYKNQTIQINQNNW